MAGTKTIAVNDSVWERLKEIMKREHAASLNQVVAILLDRATGVPASKFGVHRKLKLKFTQKEHEQITRNNH